MMYSAIPARLQFQCGHAALVTLPRVRGESAAQRNERIAREKSAALSRQCDFCAPVVEIAVNGNHHADADVHVPEVVMAQPEAELLVVASAPEQSAELAEPEPVAEVAATEPVAELADMEAVVVMAEPEPVVEVAEIEAADGVPELAPVAAAVEERVSEPEAAPAPAVAPKRRIPQTRRARAVEVARGRRFLVEYRVERVLHAVDIHDALRQAASLGAAQLTAITRED